MKGDSAALSESPAPALTGTLRNCIEHHVMAGRADGLCFTACLEQPGGDRTWLPRACLRSIEIWTCVDCTPAPSALVVTQQVRQLQFGPGHCSDIASKGNNAAVAGSTSGALPAAPACTAAAVVCCWGGRTPGQGGALKPDRATVRFRPATGTTGELTCVLRQTCSIPLRWRATATCAACNPPAGPVEGACPPAASALQRRILGISSSTCTRERIGGLENSRVHPALVRCDALDRRLHAAMRLETLLAAGSWLRPCRPPERMLLCGAWPWRCMHMHRRMHRGTGACPQQHPASPRPRSEGMCSTLCSTSSTRAR